METKGKVDFTTLPHYIDMKRDSYMPPTIMPENKCDQQLVYRAYNHFIPDTAELVNWNIGEGGGDPIKMARVVKHSSIRTQILLKEFLPYLRSYEYTGQKEGSDEAVLYMYLSSIKLRFELYYDHATGNYLCELISYN